MDGWMEMEITKLEKLPRLRRIAYGILAKNRLYLHTRMLFCAFQWTNFHLLPFIPKLI
jgi:hypothetical protein